MPDKCTRKTVRAQYVFSDELPPGCPPFELPEGSMMMELELPDLTLIVLRPGSMDRGLLAELNRYLGRVTTLGIWSRDPARALLMQPQVAAVGR